MSLQNCSEVSNPAPDGVTEAVSEAVLWIFGRFGFQKTTMTDLAAAAGLSRQTLYNRFRNKRAVLEWAVGDSTGARDAHALALLEGDERPVAAAVLDFFSEWMGALVPLLRQAPHGAELLAIGAEMRAQRDAGANDRMMQALRQALFLRAGCATPREAEGAAYVMLMAAKGLLYNSPDPAAFRTGMEKVVAVVLDRY